MPGGTSKRKQNYRDLSVTGIYTTPVPIQRSRYAHAADVVYMDLLTVSEDVSKEWRDNKKKYCKIV